MARIRTIKPEFFSSEDIVNLTPLSRLFYIALWCEADREGLLDWKIKTFKFRYFPGDNCDIESMARELVDSGLVVIHEVDGMQMAEIPTFKSHQIINNRETESTRLSRVKVATITPLVGREGKEGKGREHASKEFDDVTRPKKKPMTKIPPDFTISEKVRSWAESNGHVELEKRLENFILSCQAKGYAYADWDSAFRKAIADDWANLGKSKPQEAHQPFDVNAWLKEKTA